jgi:uncharacterized Zn-binding protein involved in type VI secretion
MPQIAREGDLCDHANAPIKDPAVSKTVFVNGAKCAIGAGEGKGSSGPCGLWQEGKEPYASDDIHPLGRDPNRGDGVGVPGPVDGSPTVFVEGIPVHRFRDRRGCGAETTTASPNVWADEIEQLSVPGATVQNPEYSPLAPTALEFYHDLGSLPATGDFYDRAVFVFTNPNNKDTFYKVRNNVNKSMNDLELSDFQAIGSQLKVRVKFEEQQTGFESADIDLATKENVPSTLQNSNQPYIAQDPDGSTSLPRIQTPGFPSFGAGDFQDTFFLISNRSLAWTFEEMFSYECTCSEGSPKFTWTQPTGKTYEFKVGNESGTVTANLTLMTMPYPPGETLAYAEDFCDNLCND